MTTRQSTINNPSSSGQPSSGRNFPVSGGAITPRACLSVQNPAVAGEMPFDEVLPNAGSNGRYQHFLLWLVLLPAQLPFGSHGYSQLLMNWTPDHWCKVPELDAIANASSHLYMKLRLYLAREYRDWGILYSQCSLNRTVYAQAVHQEAGLGLKWNSTTSTEYTCDAHGWYYNKSYLGENLDTIASAVSTVGVLKLHGAWLYVDINELKYNDV